MLIFSVNLDHTLLLLLLLFYKIYLFNIIFVTVNIKRNNFLFLNFKTQLI